MTTISACLIVRDEEENLMACLEALDPWVDQICVLDTGSRDRSVEIAREFGARLGSYEWDGDFSAARNACLELATCDWILSVDADELLDPESAGGLRGLVDLEENLAYLVWLDNLDGGTDANGKPSMQSVGIPRLFRRLPEIRWERPVHESVMRSLLALGVGQLEHSHLRLVHHGYLPEAISRGKKHERNLSILEEHNAREPEDLFNSYKLACTYGALVRNDEASELLEVVWSRARACSSRERAQLPFLPLVAAQLSRLLAAKGELSRAWEFAQQGLEDYPTVSEVLFEAAEIQRLAGVLERAGELYAGAKGCESWTDLYSGDPSTRAERPLFGLARVSALAGDLDLARGCVDRGLEMAPRSIEGRALSVRLLSVAGREADSWAGLQGLLEESPGNSEVMLLAAEMAWSRGEVETARGFWDGALADPRSAQTSRAWIAVATLVAGDLESACEIGSSLEAVDLPEAGARAVLAAVAGRPLELDPLFVPAAVLGEVAAWLAELGRDPSGKALSAFIEGAAALEVDLPGVTALLGSPEGGSLP